MTYLRSASVVGALLLLGCPQDSTFEATDTAPASSTTSATDPATDPATTGTKTTSSTDPTTSGAPTSGPSQTDTGATTSTTQPPGTTGGQGCPDRPAGEYEDCVNGGACDGAGSFCLVDDPADASFGVCSLQCADDCDCFADPAVGDARSTCAPVLEGGMKACVLDCSGGETCPAGMTCSAAFDVCVYEVDGPGTTGGDTTGEPASFCGDGVKDPGETCDDGNQSDGDACLSTCKQAGCGDGKLWNGVEACDDGNAINTDGCLTSCKQAICGDGYLWAGVEKCDDGNLIAKDGCDPNCDYSPGLPLWKVKHDIFNCAVEHSALDAEGNVVIAGRQTFTSGCLVKVANADGQLLWKKSLGYTAYATYVAENGDILVTGVIDPERAIVERRNAVGDLIWSRQHPTMKRSHGRGIAEDSTGHVVVTGFEYTGTPSDVWAAKYTAAGDLVWTTNWGAIKDFEQAEHCAVDSLDNIVFTGSVAPYGRRLVVGKFAPGGTLLWTTDTGPNLTNRFGLGVAVGPDDSIAVSGYLSESSDGWAGRFTTDGAPIWTNPDFGGYTLRAVTTDGAGNQIFVGSTLNAVLTIKADPAGNYIWARAEPVADAGGELGEGVGVDPDGFILVAAYTGKGPFVVKYAP